MTEGSSAKEISLGDGFGEVAMKANGARVSDGNQGSNYRGTVQPVLGVLR